MHNLLYRYFQRAFLFNLPRSVDFISFNVLNHNEIELYVISKFQLNEIDKSYIYAAAAEVEGDFEYHIECKVKFLIMESIPPEIEKLGHPIIAFVEHD